MLTGKPLGLKQELQRSLRGVAESQHLFPSKEVSSTIPKGFFMGNSVKGQKTKFIKLRSKKHTIIVLNNEGELQSFEMSMPINNRRVGILTPIKGGDINENS